jgi:hypothetical protein
MLAGETLAPEVMDDDIQLALDLGLVVSSPRGLEIANPIYREVIPRALTSVLEHSLSLPRASYVAPDGRLRFDLLLSDFRDFWCEHAESFLAKSPYSEAAAQLIFMAFLQRVVNGGGFIDRELAVGSGRVDLCIRWPHPTDVERWAVELKVWRASQADPIVSGLRQLTERDGELRWLGCDPAEPLRPLRGFPRPHRPQRPNTQIGNFRTRADFRDTPTRSHPVYTSSGYTLTYLVFCIGEDSRELPRRPDTRIHRQSV